MQYLLLIIIGILGGVFGGMGMGGGTVLIPLLSIFLGIVQKQAQFLNVISFVVMAVFVLIFHIKNKLVKVFEAIAFSFFGAIFSFISAMFVPQLSDNFLKNMFGFFLIVIASIQLIALIIKKKQKN